MAPKGGKRGYWRKAAVLVLLLAFAAWGLYQCGHVAYTYFRLQKMLYAIARYLASSDEISFCDATDLQLAAVKNLVLSEGRRNSAASFPALRPEMISVRVEKVDGVTGQTAVCDCSVSECDAAIGAVGPDFIVVSIPVGYTVQLKLLSLSLAPIALRPQIRIPLGSM